MTDELAIFNQLQGVASTNVPAYSNECDDFISYEGFYIHGIYTGFKWQCVEYARRWLLIRKSCIFQGFASAADMWHKLKHVERVTDGQQFSTKTYSNGSPCKPTCDSFLIYPRGEGIPFGHIAVICEVQDGFIRVAEQNYKFHFWTNNYSRQIPLIYRDGLYYIEDYYKVYGWMEIENNDQLKPLDKSNINSILAKYQQPKPIGTIEHCCISKKTSYTDRIENSLMHSNDDDLDYYKADEDFLVNISSTSNELYGLFLKATDYTIHNDELLTRFGIPKVFWSLIRRSWTNERDFNTIDYFNFKCDGEKLKLCEYKTCNPSAIFECAVVQEKWAQAMHLDCDSTSGFQLHRLLVRNWKKLDIKTMVHILVDKDRDEMVAACYMKNVMEEAGIDSKLCITLNDLCWKDTVIIDKDGEVVNIVWRVWQWETIFEDYLDRDENEGKPADGEHPCLTDLLLDDRIRVIEPLWKSIITHRELLSVVCTMFPNHRNLLSDEWISSNGSEYIHLINEQNSEDVAIDDVKKEYGIDNNANRFCDCNGIHQDPSLRKNHGSCNVSIISWMIKGLFSGFSIRNDQNRIRNANGCSTICCTV